MLPSAARGQAARTGRLIWAAVIALTTVVVPHVSQAGPPYLTDDPDPVAYDHWEFYLASQWDPIGRRRAEGSLPHVEVNFGFADRAMLHLLVPGVFTMARDGKSTYSLGDVELGANVRIVDEGAVCPQIGTFPIATVAAASDGSRFNSASVEIFLPLWMMKRLGPWTVDGGGGLHFVDGGEDLHDLQLGAFVQRSVGELASLGTEVFATIPFDGTPVRVQLNVALLLDVSDTHHLLFSGGPSLGAVHGGQAYVAWLVTL